MFKRPIPLKASGLQILDADGQTLGSTSDAQITEALVEAFNREYECPLCDVCGSMTVKSAGVFRCIKCGNAMGWDCSGQS